MVQMIRWLHAMLLALVAIACTGAAAQEFPTRPLKVILPSSPGSVADLIARTLSEPMAEELGQPVVVENVVGAAGVTGTDRMVRSPKDGHTLVVVSNSHVINPSVIKSIPFDAVKDVSLVSVLGTLPLVLVTHPSVPVRNLRELVAYAKANPGKLNYGSSGNGSVLHLAGELLASTTGIGVTHVPYKGFAGMLTDVLGGQIQMGFSGASAAAPHIKTGKLRAIGVSTLARSAILPDVPTLDEAGAPGYSFDTWMVLIAPAGTPRPVLDRLNTVARRALDTPHAKKVFADNGISAVGSPAEPVSGFLKTELEKHTRLMKQSGASLD